MENWTAGVMVAATAALLLVLAAAEGCSGDGNPGREGRGSSPAPVYTACSIRYCSRFGLDHECHILKVGG
ncbi:hypothetical protein GOP47_0003072 [Adiantum capillus-veneris]|uniref:Uncharacterized protein n=1 Tax=Adiantum capillus-veneris TaxID=13818 RepID=A0A9D4VC27_ADICA|nr:hypothetical protein GOP47_0003072 [Adiantum capillus-veneris]